MARNAIGIVYRKEFTEWVRDRRTLISTVLVPLFFFPIIMVGFTALAVVMVGKAKEETPKIMILGGEDSPQVVAGLREVKSLEIAPYRANWKDQISDKEIRAAVEIPPGFQVALEKGEPKTVKIYYHEGEMKSSFGVDRIEKFLKDYRDRVVKDRLAAKNVPISVLTPFEIRQENVAPPEKVSGATVGGKERGTMETILSSPISRMNLVLGKFLLVLSAALATAALSVMSMGISFAALRRFNMSSGRGDAAALLLK